MRFVELLSQTFPLQPRKLFPWETPRQEPSVPPVPQYAPPPVIERTTHSHWAYLQMQIEGLIKRRVPFTVNPVGRNYWEVIVQR